MKQSYLLSILFAFTFLSAILPANASTYYAAPSGLSTNNGTISSPWAFATALTKLSAGDTLWVRGGTYSSSIKINITKSGSASASIQILAYSGETPIFDFSGQPYNSNYQGIGVSGSYLHIKGLIIQGAGDNGMQVTGSYNSIENCTFRWNCDSGLQMKTGSNNYILNCDSYENFDYESTSGSSPNYGGNADGFADKQYTNTGTNTYEGCRSWRNSDDGWDHYQAVSNTIYKNCWCYNMGPASYDMTNHVRYATDKTFISNFANNIIPNYGNGNGFKLGGLYTAHNATLTNCVSVNNKVKGFDQNNNAGTMTIYNCTSYGNGTNYGFSNSTYGTLIIKNSASLASTSSNVFSCNSVTSAYNTWNTGFSCSTSDFTSLDATQLIGSRKSDGSLPDITLLHLASGSSLIDTGTDVGLTYSGSAPDLGAFEYSTTSTGINKVTVENHYSLHPNPVQESFTIEATLNHDSPVTINILSLTGQILYQTYYQGYNGANNFVINSSSLTKGTYICRFACNDFSTCTKIIK